jgi:hypothetical protein
LISIVVEFDGVQLVDVVYHLYLSPDEYVGTVYTPVTAIVLHAGAI